LHETKGVVGVGGLVFEKSIIHWINDGLMAIFFFLVGLEVKREMTTGVLRTWTERSLPSVAAIGGIAVPAAVFWFVITQVAAPEMVGSYMDGWAIPAATDIAFAVGIFAILGRHLPSSLKAFLLALAIIDDIAAVVIIALFYTNDLGTFQLAGAAGCFAILMMLNLLGVRSTAYYIVFGVIMWAFVLKSGVHATLAGVATAFTIPMAEKEGQKCLVTELEHDQHPFVAFFVLPLFAFANAGVQLENTTLDALFAPLTLAITLALFIGKQVGIFSFTWVALKLKIGRMPQGATFMQIWGVSILAGIGFTMSLFIGTLAFPEAEISYILETKIGILLGSALSAIMGLTVLWFSSKTNRQKNQTKTAT
jgi:NhaA family Na+:H+ antiporter